MHLWLGSNLRPSWMEVDPAHADFAALPFFLAARFRPRLLRLRGEGHRSEKGKRGIQVKTEQMLLTGPTRQSIRGRQLRPRDLGIEGR